MKDREQLDQGKHRLHLRSHQPPSLYTYLDLSTSAGETYDTGVVSDLFWVLDSPDVQQHLLDEREDTVESYRVRHTDEKQQEKLSFR